MKEIIDEMLISRKINILFIESKLLYYHNPNKTDY